MTCYAHAQFVMRSTFTAAEARTTGNRPSIAVALERIGAKTDVESRHSIKYKLQEASTHKSAKTHAGTVCDP